ncbi:MAG: SdpI family protein [Bacteroidetes bacterium]|nr:SdpI family protein [Bacteroidota bacterium]
METKFSLKREWMLWLVILSPLILILAKWNAFPERVPTHWNASGEVDDYGNKWSLLLLPGVNLGVYALLLVLPKIDPRKKNYDLFSGAYFLIRVSLAVLFCIIAFVTCLVSLKVKLDVGLIVQLCLIGLMLIMGNQFGRIRTNFFVGFRTPWTLSNEEVWVRTHRLAGKLWVIGGLLMIPGLFFLPQKFQLYSFFPIIILVAIIPIVYSWKIYRDITNKQQSVK